MRTVNTGIETPLNALDIVPIYQTLGGEGRTLAIAEDQVHQSVWFCCPVQARRPQRQSKHAAVRERSEGGATMSLAKQNDPVDGN